MHKRLKEINEYYDNLEYNESNKKKALLEIFFLSKEIKFKDVNDVSERFLETASVIKKNLSLFQSVCGHVDIVTTIIEYLINFGVKFMFSSEFEEGYNRDEVILLVILTIFNICKEHEVQLFLEDAIIQNLTLDKMRYENLKNKLLNQTNEMILLEDSDLHTVINYLMTIESSRLNKIWVQEAIKQKFLSLIKKYLCHKKFSIHVFRSRQELHTSRVTFYNINIVSIWSEDVITARDLATFLNKDVLFINTHMDLYGGVVLLPYIKFDDMYKGLRCNFFNRIIKPSVNEINFWSITKKESISMCSLFYDGRWQKPVKDTYWKHDETLWANATNDDIERCIMSVEQGFEIWSTMSIISRKQVLLQFASTLKYNGKFPLVDIILKWIHFSYLSENSLPCTENEKLEVINSRKPNGVIILKEENENIFFYRLIQILTTGNCVIVISNAKSYSLAPYCDMMITSGIPRGVINLLSNENISNLELNLCGTDYVNYAKQFFSDDPEETYVNLTVPKQIVFPLK